MSDSEVISAVTETLRSLLGSAFSTSTEVVVVPRVGNGFPAGTKLVLSLYNILPNGARGNSELPWKPGDMRVPLALDLHYLLAAANTTEPLEAQKDLGRGMQMLHDKPVLNPGGLAFAPFERARVTMRPLSLDDMEKLWAGVTGPRMLSVAYEVSVVLIESQQPATITLPVLSRGRGVDSIEVEAGLYPTIERIEIGSTPFDQWARSRDRMSRSVAQVDDDIFLYGTRLANATKAEVTSLRYPPPDEEDARLRLPAQPDENGAMRVRLDAHELDLKMLPAGPCAIRLLLDEDGDRGTNAVPFALAPRVTPLNGLSVPAGNDVTVKFEPKIWPRDKTRQRVWLIVGSHEIVAKSGDSPVPTDTQTFALKGVRAGLYPVRLRVDGVDSITIDLDAPPDNGKRPAFSNKYQITVT